MHASLSRASFRFPEEVSSIRLPASLSLSFISIQESPRMETRSPSLGARIGDLGENRTINGIPHGMNDCEAASLAKFKIEDRTADRIYRVVATWVFPRENLSTFSYKCR